MALPKALGNSGGVRRYQDIVERPERRACRQRLFIEDIESGAGDTTLLQGIEQRRFVDQRPAGYVDQVSVGFILLRRAAFMSPVVAGVTGVQSRT